jgi:hypothetical protein
MSSLQLERIFISYDDKTGLPMATAIREALLGEHISGWVWEIDHPRGYVFSEIARRIQEADYICYVCTEGSLESEGQEWEIENAFGQGKAKRSWVVATDRIFVPIVLAGYFQHPITEDSLPESITEWVAACRAGFPGWRSVQTEVAPTEKLEEQPLSLSNYASDES